MGSVGGSEWVYAVLYQVKSNWDPISGFQIFNSAGDRSCATAFLRSWALKGSCSTARNGETDSPGASPQEIGRLILTRGDGGRGGFYLKILFPSEFLFSESLQNQDYMEALFQLVL